MGAAVCLQLAALAAAAAQPAAASGDGPGPAGLAGFLEMIPPHANNNGWLSNFFGEHSMAQGSIAEESVSAASTGVRQKTDDELGVGRETLRQLQNQQVCDVGAMGDSMALVDRQCCQAVPTQGHHRSLQAAMCTDVPSDCTPTCAADFTAFYERCGTYLAATLGQDLPLVADLAVLYDKCQALKSQPAAVTPAEAAQEFADAEAAPATALVAVASQISFDADIRLIPEGSAQRAQFETDFKGAISSALGDGSTIPQEHVLVDDIRAGSEASAQSAAMFGGGGAAQPQPTDPLAPLPAVAGPSVDVRFHLAVAQTLQTTTISLLNTLRSSAATLEIQVANRDGHNGQMMTAATASLLPPIWIIGGPPPPPPPVDIAELVGQLQCSIVSRDTIIFQDTVYEKYLTSPCISSSPGMYQLTLAGPRQEFQTSSAILVNHYQHLAIMTSVSAASLAFGSRERVGQISMTLFVSATARLSIEGSFAEMEFWGTTKLYEGVELTMPSSLTQLKFYRAVDVYEGATLNITSTAGAVVTFAYSGSDIYTGASVIVSGSELRIEQGDYVYFHPGSFLTLDTVTTRILHTETALVYEDGGTVAAVGSTARNYFGALFTIIWSADMQGQAIVTDVTVAESEGQTLFTMNGVVPGDMQLELTAAGLTYFDTTLASGVVTRAADGTETSAWPYLGTWDGVGAEAWDTARSSTNRAGNSFTLYLLPARLISSNGAEGSQAYFTACDELGLRTVGTGVSSRTNNYHEACSAYNCMPLPPDWGDSSVDEVISRNTGWKDIVIHYLSPDRLSLGGVSNGPANNGHARGLRPVCARED